ncbi:hypothetical protein [Neoroseomonas soli]|uniref:Uncharacterized protein n=1 Tax=Neoroseomonas soli TaxID=1081025 RepID=A0A9X9X1B3_9PROT|nr:hypothetical protein [Neoroseomonas soli]MBR0673192.1 hypothetical protein [Neoroseomonas soli]
MDTRTKSKLVEFRTPFLVSARSGPMPAGRYRVVIEEEKLLGISFPAWRRTRMTIAQHGLPNGRMPRGTPITSAELMAALFTDREVPS